MAKTVPVGYVDMILNITRAGDPDPYAVTFGGKVTGGPFDVSSLEQVAAATEEHLRTELNPIDRFSGLTAYVASDGPPFIYEWPMDVVGTSPGQPTSQNVALIITKDSGLGGRWNRGRMFWPSVNEAAIDGLGVLAAPYRTGTQGAFNDWRVAMTNGTLDTDLEELVIFHDESLGILPTPVTFLTVEPVVGTQRRRLRR